MSHSVFYSRFWQVSFFFFQEQYSQTTVTEIYRPLYIAAGDITIFTHSKCENIAFTLKICHHHMVSPKLYRAQWRFSSRKVQNKDKQKIKTRERETESVKQWLKISLEINRSSVTCVHHYNTSTSLGNKTAASGKILTLIKVSVNATHTHTHTHMRAHARIHSIKWSALIIHTIWLWEKPVFNFKTLP